LTLEFLFKKLPSQTTFFLYFYLYFLDLCDSHILFLTKKIQVDQLQGRDGADFDLNPRDGGG
jgi:hypothetical protein